MLLSFAPLTLPNSRSRPTIFKEQHSTEKKIQDGLGGFTLKDLIWKIIHILIYSLIHIHHDAGSAKGQIQQ